MPKPRLLMEHDIKAIRYVSMADYIRRMDELQYPEDKLAFTTAYLMDYVAGANRDVPLAEAIHIAKVKMADASAQLRRQRIMVPDEVFDPEASEEKDAEYRLFMADPLEYIKEEANRQLLSYAGKGLGLEEAKQISKLQEVSAAFNPETNGELASEVLDLDENHTARDVHSRLEAKYGSARALVKAHNATKPGVLAGFFGKYSKAYANLEDVYNAFHNPNHILYGDMNAMDKAAVQYLQHALPDWDFREGLPKASYIDRNLSGTRKARANFSLQILKSTIEQRRSEGVYDALNVGTKQWKAEREAQAGDSVLEEEANQQQAFQQNVNDNLIQDEEVSYDKDAEEKFAANFKDDPEEDNDGPKID